MCWWCIEICIGFSDFYCPRSINTLALVTDRGWDLNGTLKAERQIDPDVQGWKRSLVTNIFISKWEIRDETLGFVCVSSKWMNIVERADVVGNDDDVVNRILYERGRDRGKKDDDEDEAWWCDVIGEGPQGAKPQQLRELGNPLGVIPLD